MRRAASLASGVGDGLGSGDICRHDEVLGARARHPVLDILAALFLELDAHVLEAGSFQHLGNCLWSARPRNSTGESLVRLEFFWELGNLNYVSHSEAATLAKNAECLKDGHISSM